MWVWVLWCYSILSSTFFAVNVSLCWLFVVSTTISQLDWIQFSRPKRLQFRFCGEIFFSLIWAHILCLFVCLLSDFIVGFIVSLFSMQNNSLQQKYTSPSSVLMENSLPLPPRTSWWLLSTIALLNNSCFQLILFWFAVQENYVCQTDARTFISSQIDIVACTIPNIWLTDCVCPHSEIPAFHRPRWCSLAATAATTSPDYLPPPECLPQCHNDPLTNSLDLLSAGWVRCQSPKSGGHQLLEVQHPEWVFRQARSRRHQSDEETAAAISTSMTDQVWSNNMK